MRRFDNKTQTVKTGMAGTDGLDFQTADFDFVAGRNGDLSRALSLGNLIEFIQILQNHKGIFPGIKIRQMIAGFQIMNDAVKMIRMRMGQKNGFGRIIFPDQQIPNIRNRGG